MFKHSVKGQSKHEKGQQIDGSKNEDEAPAYGIQFKNKDRSCQNGCRDQNAFAIFNKDGTVTFGSLEFIKYTRTKQEIPGKEHDHHEQLIFPGKFKSPAKMMFPDIDSKVKSAYRQEQLNECREKIHRPFFIFYKFRFHLSGA
jgi:hypothetical protein